MDPSQQLAPTSHRAAAGTVGSSGPAPTPTDGVTAANQLVAALVAAGDERPLREHVDTFEQVHGALVDALAQTGN